MRIPATQVRNRTSCTTFTGRTSAEPVILMRCKDTKSIAGEHNAITIIHSINRKREKREKVLT